MRTTAAPASSRCGASPRSTRPSSCTGGVAGFDRRGAGGASGRAGEQSVVSGTDATAIEVAGAAPAALGQVATPGRVVEERFDRRREGRRVAYRGQDAVLVLA